MQHRHLARRRALRARSTVAERLLWHHVRAGRLGAKFRRQHALGDFIVDFYCPAAQLVVELDGGQRYASDASDYDARRTAWLAALGLRIVRFTNLEVSMRTADVLEAIRSLLAAPPPESLLRVRS